MAGKNPEDEELDRRIRSSIDRIPRPDRYTPAKQPPSEPWRPKSAPVHEETKPGGFTPAPGSRGPEKRIYTPPGFASPREVAAIDAMAESRRERVVKAPESRAPKPPEELSPEVIATAKLIRTGGKALGKWIAGIVASVVLGGGGALVGSKASNPVPPAVLQCPAELEQLRGDMKILRDRVGSTERDIDEATIDRRAQKRKHESLQSEVYEIGKRVPKVHP